MNVPGVSRPGSEMKRRSELRVHTTPYSIAAGECTPESAVPALRPSTPARLGPEPPAWQLWQRRSKMRLPGSEKSSAAALGDSNAAVSKSKRIRQCIMRLG